MYQVWINATQALRDCDTLVWFPMKIPMPFASSSDLILAGLQDIIDALKNPRPGVALAPFTDSHSRALRELTSLLATLPTPPTTVLLDITPPTPIPVPRVDTLRTRVPTRSSICGTPPGFLPLPPTAPIPLPEEHHPIITFAESVATTYGDVTGPTVRQARKRHA